MERRSTSALPPVPRSVRVPLLLFSERTQCRAIRRPSRIRRSIRFDYQPQRARVEPTGRRFRLRREPLRCQATSDTFLSSKIFGRGKSLSGGCGKFKEPSALASLIGNLVPGNALCPPRACRCCARVQRRNISAPPERVHVGVALLPQDGEFRRRATARQVRHDDARLRRTRGGILRVRDRLADLPGSAASLPPGRAGPRPAVVPVSKITGKLRLEKISSVRKNRLVHSDRIPSRPAETDSTGAVVRAAPALRHSDLALPRMDVTKAEVNVSGYFFTQRRCFRHCRFFPRRCASRRPHRRSRPSSHATRTSRPYHQIRDTTCPCSSTDRLRDGYSALPGAITSQDVDVHVDGFEQASTSGCFLRSENGYPRLCYRQQLPARRRTRPEHPTRGNPAPRAAALASSACTGPGIRTQHEFAPHQPTGITSIRAISVSMCSAQTGAVKQQHALSSNKYAFPLFVMPVDRVDDHVVHAEREVHHTADAGTSDQSHQFGQVAIRRHLRRGEDGVHSRARPGSSRTRQSGDLGAASRPAAASGVFFARVDQVGYLRGRVRRAGHAGGAISSAVKRSFAEFSKM